MAKRLALHARTVRRLIEDGELPAYRFGGSLRVRADELEVFEKQARVVPRRLASAGAGLALKPAKLKLA